MMEFLVVLKSFDNSSERRVACQGYSEAEIKAFIPLHLGDESDSYQIVTIEYL